MTENRLRDYQELAVGFLQNVPRAALFLDMGLGKTAICLSALTEEHLPALVIAPKRVAEHTWEAERDLWRPDLSISLAVGSPSARAASLASRADLTVISRDNQKDLLAAQDAPRFRTLIIDELSGYKGRGTRWKQARDIIKRFDIKNVWGLTGTPTPNGYLDLWPQIALLDNGARLGKNITTYRSRYFYPGRQISTGVVVEWHLRPEAEDRIKELISDIALSMETNGRVVLPELTTNVIRLDLPKASRKAYRDIKNDLVANLTGVFDEGEVHTASNAAVLTSKLAQISAGFMYVDDADIREGKYTHMHSAKTEAVKEIVDVATSPVLVFYRFKAELDALRAAFPKASTMNDKDVVKRWNAGAIPVLLAHPASAGHGLNLQHGGHTIVWTSLPWSLEEWEQANKRVFRSGQKHPVVIHLLMMEKTVDWLVRASLEGKALTQDSLLEYLESPI